MTRAWPPSTASLDELTSGRGADHVFLAAGGSSNAPVEIAAKLARDRARVVDIGKTKLDLPWNAYYDKELDVRFSRSYGPGRYDDRYELEGIDYPAGYVRWTERRNLECFLDLLARKDLEVETLVSGTFPMDDAGSVYADLSSGALKAVGRPARVPGTGPRAPATARHQPGPRRRPVRPARLERTERPAQASALAVGFIGAGNYASSMLLPHLASCRTSELAHVATTRSLSAVNAQRRFGFTTASTSADGRAGGRVAGCDLHRDAAPHARRPGLPGAGGREGGVRGEAAGADRRGAGPDPGRDRADRQRPAHGRVQPAVRAAADGDDGPVRPGQPARRPGTW